MADAFRSQVLHNKDADNSPVVTLGSCSFLYTREARFSGKGGRVDALTAPRAQNNVYLLALTQGNTNAAAAFRFLRQAR